MTGLSFKISGAWRFALACGTKSLLQGRVINNTFKADVTIYFVEKIGPTSPHGCKCIPWHRSRPYAPRLLVNVVYN